MKILFFAEEIELTIRGVCAREGQAEGGSFSTVRAWGAI